MFLNVHHSVMFLNVHHSVKRKLSRTLFALNFHESLNVLKPASDILIAMDGN